jgi:hypothetical protein
MRRRKRIHCPVPIRQQKKFVTANACEPDQGGVPPDNIGATARLARPPDVSGRIPPVLPARRLYADTCTASTRITPGGATQVHCNASGCVFGTELRGMVHPSRGSALPPAKRQTIIGIKVSCRSAHDSKPQTEPFRSKGVKGIVKGPCSGIGSKPQ